MEPISAAIMGTSMLASGGISAIGANATNKAQRGFAREMFARQLEADNTAVQRRVKDLQAAGINPLMAAGASAASPSGGSAGNFSNPGKAFADNIDPVQLIGIEQARANVDQTKAQEGYIKSQQKGVDLQNELHQMTIDWYKNHPQFAPGVQSGVYTGSGIAQTAEALKHNYNVIRGKFDKWLNENNDALNTYLRNRGGAVGRWLAGKE